MGDLGDEHLARMTTARTRELGHELHLARKRANLKATAVAEELGWSPGKLSKLERGWRQTSEWDYGTLLGKLGVDPQTRARIHRIAAEQDIGHFIRAHNGRLSDNLLCLMIHEKAALTMAVYEPMVIPGLLQTSAYAKAMISMSGEDPLEDIDFCTAARMDRQSILTGSSAPEAVFYIHEAALQAVVGSAEIMHDQLMRLTFMCEWSHLSPRVIPRSAPGHPSLRGPFNLMTFGRPVKPVSYTETDTATLFIEEEQAITTYQRKKNALARLALDAEQSRSVFAQWADVYDRRGDRDDQGSDLA
ncbi:helix-turn-helix transcriptional regulator [Umezawaea sp. Da 62-37]|uniref:helix-turn-helix domain-containing protein n=1 Tax=Umezawaea sp. Da 62-37 TaxID=3075927 RepID=UPI0028F71FEC|nr:helix-turn-helix transcriptional regulator [Umezawaea sp. Da 62-37]WNV91414.1 helix-turn-helix transcriptional regulator [Umezawaea sp. Da 62-37]